ncbi:MAG: hypothetical protein PHP44_10905 [Kiritimatiellae bacterium]|nr:hypothetical protein [Kiritimatiellia bacterium]
MKTKEPVAIISNLAPVGPHEARFFADLLAAFKTRGWTPYVWSIPNSAYSECHIPLSWTISRWPSPQQAYGAEEMQEAYSLIDVSKWRERVGQLVKQYCDVAQEGDRLLDIIVRNSWDILKKYQPSLFLSWNTLCPHTGILHEMCGKLGIQAVLLERAFFPNTWFLEEGGLLGHSILARKCLDDLIPAGDYTRRVEDGTKILQGLDTRSYVKYQQNQTTTFTDLQNHPRANRPKIVFFPPDDGTLGFVPVHHEDRCKTLPGYSSSFDAARCLAAEYDGLVVFKPHPSFIGRQFDVSGLDNLFVVDHDFRDLIVWADIIASTGSGLAFLALNAGKPVISMSVDILFNKGIVYEAVCREEIPLALHRALNNEECERHDEHYRALVSYLYSDYLVSLASEKDGSLNTVDAAIGKLLNRRTL